jgi:hypothetical protein
VNIALGARELPSLLDTDAIGWPGPTLFSPVSWPALLLARVVPPVLALNLFLALLPAFNALSGYVLGRALHLDAWGSFAVGGLTALNAWTLNTLSNGQFEQVPLGAAALIWAAVVVACRDGGAAPVLPGVVFLAVGLAAPHVGVAAALGSGVLLLVEVGRGRWRRVAVVGVGVLAGALLVSGYHSPQFAGGSHVFAPKGSTETGNTRVVVAGLWEVATPARLFLAPEPPTPGTRGVAHCAYLGWVGIVAALVGARARSARPFLAVAVLLACASCIDTLPTWFGALSDALRRTANPYRLVLGAVAALAAAAGFAVRGPRSALLVVVAAIGELGIVNGRPVPIPATSWVPHASTIALAGGSAPVLDLPLASPRCPEGGWHAAVQVAFGGPPTPLVLDFDWRAWGVHAGDGHAVDHILRSATCATALPAWLRKRGYGAVVLHTDERCALEPGIADCLETALGAGETGPEGRWWTLAAPAIRAGLRPASAP